MALFEYGADSVNFKICARIANKSDKECIESLRGYFGISVKEFASLIGVSERKMYNVQKFNEDGSAKKKDYAVDLIRLVHFVTILETIDGVSRGEYVEKLLPNHKIKPISIEAGG